MRQTRIAGIIWLLALAIILFGAWTVRAEEDEGHPWGGDAEVIEEDWDEWFNWVDMFCLGLETQAKQAGVEFPTGGIEAALKDTTLSVNQHLELFVKAENFLEHMIRIQEAIDDPTTDEVRKQQARALLERCKGDAENLPFGLSPGGDASMGPAYGQLVRCGKHCGRRHGSCCKACDIFDDWCWNGCALEYIMCIQDCMDAAGGGGIPFPAGR